jgi:CHAD domain-containing protein
MAGLSAQSQSEGSLPTMDAVTYTSSTMPLEQLTSALAGAGFEVGRFRPVDRRRLDTFDGRLHAAGVRLEFRSSAGPQLIATGGGPAPAHLSIECSPTVAGDLPVGPLRTRLAQLLDIRALRPVAEAGGLHANAVRRNESGKATVGLAVHDRLTGAAGQPLSVTWAVEAVAFEGYPRAFREAEKLLASLGLTRHDGDVLDLAAADSGIDLRGFVGSPTVALDPSEPAVDGFRRVLANLADTIEANRQGTIDDVDPEFLHDLRIAVRRSRSIISHGKKVLPAGARDHFGAELRWLGTVTSPLRDLDVYVIEWPGYVAPLDAESTAALAPVVEHIASRRAAEHATLALHLRSARFEGLMAAWRAWLDAPTREEADLPKGSTRPLGPIVVKRISDAQDRLLLRGRGIDHATPAEELHELRKDAKRLRYLLECFGGLLPASARKPFVQRLKALQDNLGEHQDTEVHTAQLRAMSQELHGSPGVSAETLLAMGRLTEVFDQRRQAARDEFAERFTAYDSKQTARALAGLLGSVS